MFWSIKYLMLAVAVALGASSIVSNFSYGVTIGAGWMPLVYGFAGAAVDVFKLVIPTVAFLILSADPRREPAFAAARPMLGSLWTIFVVLTLWSVWCAYSLQAQSVEKNRAGYSATRDEATRLAGQASRLSETIEGLEQEMERPREALEADLAAMRRDPIYGAKRTKGCSSVTWEESRRFCDAYDALEAQRNGARPIAEIRADLRKARATLNANDASQNLIGARAGEREDLALRALADATDLDLALFVLGRAAAMAISFELVGSFAGAVAAWAAKAQSAASNATVRPKRSAPPAQAPQLPPPPAARMRRSAAPRPERCTVTRDQAIEAAGLMTGDGRLSGRKAAEELGVPESSLRNAMKREGIQIVNGAVVLLEATEAA
ncbi:MAG: hypothetical protein AAGM38_18570 [Pseudomonadota bacterium]